MGKGPGALLIATGPATRELAMQETIVRVPEPSVNGHAKPAKAKAKRRKAKPAPLPVQVSTLRRWTTVGMGCGIPGLSLALSSVGGSLIESGHYSLGAGALGLCCAVLAVSLSHLASAIRDITHSRPWQAWLLALTIDCSLIVCELSRVSGFASWLVPVVMVGVTVASMWLNCWAFLSDEA